MEMENAWQGSYYLKADGKMAQSEWIYDSSYQAWYYLTSDGFYAYSTCQKKRMYRQLTSDFDKFSNDAAQYAIVHLDD